MIVSEVPRAERVPLYDADTKKPLYDADTKTLIYRNVADTSDYLIVRAGNNYTTTDPYISFRTHVGVGFHDDSGWNTGRLDMPNYIYENNLPLSNISKYEHLLGEWRSKTDKYYKPILAKVPSNRDWDYYGNMQVAISLNRLVGFSKNNIKIRMASLWWQNYSTPPSDTSSPMLTSYIDAWRTSIIPSNNSVPPAWSVSKSFVCPWMPLLHYAHATYLENESTICTIHWDNDNDEIIII